MSILWFRHNSISGVRFSFENQSINTSRFQISYNYENDITKTENYESVWFHRNYFYYFIRNLCHAFHFRHAKVRGIRIFFPKTKLINVFLYYLNRRTC